jgi:hypothetical protein
VLASLAAIAYFKIALLPILDQSYSVRAFWRENAARIEMSCLNGVGRNWAYGLNYYAGRSLPGCTGTVPQIVVRDGRLTMSRP